MYTSKHLPNALNVKVKALTVSMQPCFTILRRVESVQPHGLGEEVPPNRELSEVSLQEGSIGGHQDEAHLIHLDSL